MNASGNGSFLSLLRLCASNCRPRHDPRVTRSPPAGRRPRSRLHWQALRVSGPKHLAMPVSPVCPKHLAMPVSPVSGNELECQVQTRNPGGPCGWTRARAGSPGRGLTTRLQAVRPRRRARPIMAWLPGASLQVPTVPLLLGLPGPLPVARH